MLSNLGQVLLNKVNFDYDDQAAYFPGVIKDLEKFLTWNDVEDCANRPELWDFEIIDETSNKVSTPASIKTWVNKEVQDKRFLVNSINKGYTAIITNYGFRNQYTNELLNTFENIFDIHAAIHVYCGLAGSKSFSIHDDYPCNFIIQVEGETPWTVYKNRISYMYQTGRMNNKLKDDMLEVAVDVVLKPGDMLYIPSRAYHVAKPQGPRLSMSIPCWNKLKTDNPNLSVDRNYYRINHE
jgi:hypothetical protein